MPEPLWQSVDDLLAATLDQPPEARAAYLASAAAHDPQLRDEVAALLRCHADAEAALGDSATAYAAPLLDVLDPADAGLVELADEEAVRAGELIGPYRIVREIGRGGMAAVYLAERADQQFRRQVALKLVKRGMDTDEVLRRFRQERQILASLEHPNIARLFDGGADCRRPALSRRWSTSTALPIDRYCDEHGLGIDASDSTCSAPICEAVQFAHQSLVIHRDIKPSNILVTPDGTPKLLDFGIAKLLVDEPGQSRPEHADRAPGCSRRTTPARSRSAARHVTTATDVYSLGVVLYVLLAGRHPHEGETTSADELAAAVLRRPPAPPSRAAPAELARELRGGLDRIVLTAIEKDPGRRYASAAALAEDLGRWLDGQPVLAPRRARLSSRGVRQVALVAAAVVAIAAGLALWPRAARGPAAEASASPRGAGGSVALAVLPIAAASGDTSVDYVAAGIQEDLTARLGKLDRVLVKSTRAVAAVPRAALASPLAARRSLGVDYLVEGALRRVDRTLRLSLRLIETDTGLEPWAEEFAIPAGGLLALQDTIARQVAQAVAGNLSSADAAALRRRLTSGPEAYDHFLRGNFRLIHRTPRSLVAAVREYEAAGRLDSTFAEALVRRAYTYLLFADWSWPFPGLTTRQLLDSADAVGSRALAQDSGSAEAWLVRAYLLTQRDPYRMAGAVDAFQRALARDSTNAEAYHQYGQTLMMLGRDQEAMAAYHRVLALEPERPMTLVPMASIVWKQGRREEAGRWADSSVAIAQTVSAPYAWAFRGVIRLDAGDADRARRDAERALETDSSYAVPARSVLARALARQGDTVRARLEVDRALTEINQPFPSPTDVRYLGSALAELGRDEEAIRMLEQARPRGAMLWFYLNGPDFARIRRDPRFVRVWREADPRAAAS